MIAAGARLAATPAEAVEASELIILSLTDYQAMWDILDVTADSLAGRTLVDLSSDTPDKTRRASMWAADHGASFIFGGIQVPAAMVGTSLSYAYDSGYEDAFDAHRIALARIGDPQFLGEDPGRSQLGYRANLDLFLTTLAGFAHAIAVVGFPGITAKKLLARHHATIRRDSGQHRS